MLVIVSWFSIALTILWNINQGPSNLCYFSFTSISSKSVRKRSNVSLFRRRKWLDESERGNQQDGWEGTNWKLFFGVNTLRATSGARISSSGESNLLPSSLPLYHCYYNLALSKKKYKPATKYLIEIYEHTWKSFVLSLFYNPLKHAENIDKKNLNDFNHISGVTATAIIKYLHNRSQWTKQ